MKPHLLLCTSSFLFLFLFSNLSSQELGFERFDMNPLPPTLGSGLESGDLNGDGIDDLVMAGEFLNENDDPNVTIFYTLGNGEFEEFELSVALTNASFEIFDADGDGDNDLVAAGRDDWEPYTRLFLNDGNGNFQSPSNSAEFIPIYFGNIESWDVDGDGDLDLLIGGDGENLPSVARIYFNDGNGGFEISNSLALYTSNSGNVIRDIRFVDIDADQDQDVLMSFNFGAPQVFLNNGLGEFDEQEIDFQFDFLGSDFFGIADFNDDGFPDLIGNRRIHFNQGDYIFEESEFELSLFPEENFSESTYRKRFFPGDFDADGDIDLVLCGTIELEDSLHNDALRSYTRLYENSGQGNFQLVEDAGIRGFSECAIVSGNFVGDENEDLIFVGSNHYLSPDCEIYEGLGDLHFDPYDRFPFTFVRNSRTVQEDFNGDGRMDLIISGVTRSGSLDANFSIFMNDGLGKYRLLEDQPFACLSNDIDVVTIDIENDGDMDLYVNTNGQVQSHYSHVLYENDGSGNFSIYQFLDDTLNQSGFTLNQTGDLNNDGFTDIVVSFESPTKFLINDGQGSFNVLEAPGLPGLSEFNFDHDFGLFDVDDDGDLDIISMPGNTMAVGYADVYLNDGNASFTLGQDPPQFRGAYDSRSLLTFADFNNDGRKDIFISGRGSTFNYGGSVLYENLGGGEYFEHEVEVQLSWAFLNGYVCAEDMNDDGFIDLLMTQEDETKLFLNNGNFTFTDGLGANFLFPDHSFGTINAFDTDDDGDKEVIITGSMYESFLYAQETSVYDNSLYLSTLSVQDKKEDIQTSILFPNPTSHTFTIKGTSNWVEIYDLTGRLVYSEYGNEVMNRNIDISSEKPGIYLIRTNKGTEKLILN